MALKSLEKSQRQTLELFTSVNMRVNNYFLGQFVNKTKLSADFVLKRPNIELTVSSFSKGWMVAKAVVVIVLFLGALADCKQTLVWTERSQWMRWPQVNKLWVKGQQWQLVCTTCVSDKFFGAVGGWRVVQLTETAARCSLWSQQSCVLLPEIRNTAQTI